ncbi:unnamed protein product [Adineta ricciae]|uniref:Uncharacterized protein n=1 Tax=Adineta ricciae TaxID=249248 RepID=A0A815FXI1_ADIRI|nr:unnamed protein product [Adineta ricciae]CAF1331200.1 unnamed protein product [Adineta ricciae]
MKLSQSDECNKLISKKISAYNDSDQYHHASSSRLQSAESSWTRCLQLLFCSWMDPTLYVGYKRSLTEDDLDGLPHKDKASIAFNRFDSYDWATTSTWRLIIREFWRDYLVFVVFCLPYIFVRVSQPLLLREIVLSTMNENTSLITICFLVLLLCSCGIVQVLLDHQIYFYSIRIGVRIRNALMTLIYRNSLSMKITVSQTTNIGHITNLISDDASRFGEICTRLQYLWVAPIETLIIFSLLCWIIKPLPAILSFILLVLSIIILSLISHCLSDYRHRKTVYSDKRVHAFNEFIHGYHIIKMHNWEKSMEDRIRKIRQDEVNNLNRYFSIRTISTIHSFIIVPALAFVTFITAWLLDYPLEAADCFSTLAFFGLIRNQIMFFVPAITDRLTDIIVASKRIDAFMRSAVSQCRSASTAFSSIESVRGQISMSDASFSWNTDQCCLSSLDILIQPQTFVGIVGPVGSGKSSLLVAILGELNLLHGQLISNHNSFAYTSQSPWIFSDTIRNNILLNRPFDERRYRNVIYACCLDVDIQSFGTSGDLTMIGERGVNLSGGQKARVSLARSVYSDVDVYLIDDPLAAVDGIVAKQIYDRCFSSQGLLKNKTRLLVTHQTQFLADADQILFLSQGRIDNEGRLDDYTHTQGMTDTKEVSEMDCLLDESTSAADTRSIISEERSVTGNVNWNAWFCLFTAPPFGICGLCALVILMVVGEILYDGTNYWLSIWLKESHADQQKLPTFAYTYLELTLGIVLSDILRTIVFFSIFLHGVNHFHDRMLKALLYTSVEFFESNPSGRILNRVSNDQKVIEEPLPAMMISYIKLSLMSMGSIVIICLVKPYLVLVVIALIPIIVFVCRFYLRSKKQLKKLESITRSPVYDLLSSSLNGLVTLRAFKIEDYFIQLFTNAIDRNTRAFLNLLGAAR